jgi:hypothetical protein
MHPILFYTNDHYEYAWWLTAKDEQNKIQCNLAHCYSVVKIQPKHGIPTSCKTHRPITQCPIHQSLCYLCFFEGTKCECRLWYTDPLSGLFAVFAQKRFFFSFILEFWAKKSVKHNGFGLFYGEDLTQAPKVHQLELKWLWNTQKRK